MEGVKWRAPSGHERILDVRMVPVVSDGELLGTAVTYQDATDVVQLEADLTESRRDLAQAHEELQSTVEELETTNEELQSTNEELETTNEELQSTNEELETMNEELQSTNEELETMNDELRQRTFELNDVNAFLETILTTIGLSVVVLDRQLHVQLWNGQSRELWGLSSEDVEGQHLLGLDIGLPVEQLRPMLLACLKGEDGASAGDAGRREPPGQGDPLQGELHDPLAARRRGGHGAHPDDGAPVRVTSRAARTLSRIS